MDHAARSIDGVLGKYGDMLREEIGEGEERVLALEGMVRAARLPRHMADPIRDAAVAHLPRNMYDLYNLLTYVSTHGPIGLPDRPAPVAEAAAASRTAIR